MQEDNKEKKKGRTGTYYIKYDEKAQEKRDCSPFVRERLEKKYNLKIKSSDLDLIDEIARNENVTRSVILNFLIHKILCKELRSLPNEDVKILVAERADKKRQGVPGQDKWVLYCIWPVIEDYVKNACKNMKRFNLSDASPGYCVENAEQAGVVGHSKEYESLLKLWEK